MTTRLSLLLLCDPSVRRNQKTCRRLGIEGEIVVVPLWVLNPKMATKLDVLVVSSK